MSAFFVPWSKIMWTKSFFSTINMEIFRINVTSTVRDKDWKQWLKGSMWDCQRPTGCCAVPQWHAGAVPSLGFTNPLVTPRLWAATVSPLTTRSRVNSEDKVCMTIGRSRSRTWARERQNKEHVYWRGNWHTEGASLLFAVVRNLDTNIKKQFLQDDSDRKSVK